MKFTDSGEPQWKLRAEWREQSAGGMRFATLLIGDSDNPLELRVIPLPTPQGDTTSAALANVNRWRSQLGLSDLSARAFLDESSSGDKLKRVELGDGTEAIVVNLTGNLTGGGGMQAPFAGRGGGPAQSARPTAPVKLAYEVPEGWEEISAAGMRRAAFVVKDGDQNAEITIISLARPPGDSAEDITRWLLDNFNRWRRQIGLPDTTQDELRNELRQVKIGGLEGLSIELVGPESAENRETIFGALTFHAGQSWFIKLKGSSELAEREKSNFEKFLSSIQFSQDRGDAGG